MTNKQCLEQYLEENLDRLCRLAFSFALNQNDAEDIIGDSVMKALKAIDTLKEPDYVGTWMYRIVINTAITANSKKARTMIIDPHSTEWETLYRHAPQEEYFQEIHFQDIIASLNQDQRVLVVLRYLEDLPLATIGEMLGENVNTIKTRLYRALKKLRSQMEENHE